MKETTDVLIFAGTTEGRNMAEYLSEKGLNIHVCVATEYGCSLLPVRENITVSQGRMEAADMEAIIKELKVPVVIDATHPYAVLVTENIKNACALAGVEYIRLVRDTGEAGTDISYVDNTEEAVKLLRETKGNVLVTTGSKELRKFTAIEDYKNRLFVRVLSTKESVEDSIDLGFEGANLICMQGPFSEELNHALLKQINAAYLVTKESGKAGGFMEKLEAAERAGVSVIVIGRPVKEEGLSYVECIKAMKQKFSIKSSKKISLVGIGMGSSNNMTLEAVSTFMEADLIIGAKRMIEALEIYNKPFFISYKEDEIKNYIEEHEEFENIVIALSGDSGFCSGAKKLCQALDEYRPVMISGVSTVSYLCSKLGQSWDDACLLSMHGKEENIPDRIIKNKKVFALMGGENSIKDLCEKLVEYNLNNVIIHVGERLSYEDEKITTGRPEELIEISFDSLCAVLICNNSPVESVVTHGIADDEFIRDKAPMTKEEVRSISLSKLQLKSNSVVYDIGAGTGSVSVEMALQAKDGKVFAIEKNQSSATLIEKNKKKFKVFNLETVNGLAPEVLLDLPFPTHAFIGGSSGNMKEILGTLFEKNPAIRIVMNVSTLETLSEVVTVLKEFEICNLSIVQANISRAKKIGNYSMMEGLNPVNIISFTGEK